MKFIDEAIIKVKAGKGGAGSRHFRREKFVPLGGPDGGNGGQGGSVILLADRNKNTLLDFQYRFHWDAENGAAGGGSGKDGKQGQDLIIHVPVGTQILKLEVDDIIGDLSSDGQRFVLAKGGRGGKGNAFFKSATNQAPEHAQPGEEGESGEYRLSLKLVADVGIIGFPNAGKSTLISRISAARPKIADYPFTTLEPNLGVVRAKGGNSFVVADIPGLIPGAHSGKGLGIKFLKHIERTRLLVHLVDPNQLDTEGRPVPLTHAFEAINQELSAFSQELADREQIVVVSKADTVTDQAPAQDFLATLKRSGIECRQISSVAGTGIEELIDLIARRLQQIS
ncbi:MAG: GTPase ObgE [Oligoflexia bacterium]|nr:GTPase ObgE [Oligoflexia bacterium]